MNLPSINEISNKVLLLVGGAVLTLAAIGLRAYTDKFYVSQHEYIEERIEEMDRKIYEINEVFITVEQLDTITARRLGMFKAFYENRKADLLRQQAKLQ